MGHEIVYCSRCLTRLISADFEAGKARRLGNQVACTPCAETLLSQMSPQEREAVLLTESSTKARTVRDSTRRSPLPHPTTRSVRAEGRHVAPARRGSPIVPILVVVGLVGGGLILVLAMGSGRGTPAPPKAPAPETRTAASPEPAPPPLVLEASPAEREALRLLNEARGIPSDDLERKIAAYADVISKAGLTPVYEKAREEHDALLKTLELRFPALLAERDAEAKPLRDREEFRKAGDVYRRARGRFAVPSWHLLIEGRVKDIRRQAEVLFGFVTEKASAARARGEQEMVEALRAQVAKWGYTDLTADLDARLGKVDAPVAPSAALKAYLPVWKEAMAIASRRDYDGALARVDGVLKSAEEEDLKGKAQVDKRLLERLRDLHRETRAVLSRWPKGRSLGLQYFDAERKLMEVEGPVVGTGPHRVEFADENGSFFIELDDVTLFGLAKAYRASRGRIPAGNARALAFGCLLEGDAEGAKELLKDTDKNLPKKCWTFATEARGKLSPLDPRERQARKLFHEAEVQYRNPATRAEAAVAYARLADEYASTRIVSRELDRVRERKEAGKEYVFFPDRIAAQGTFKKTEHDKVGSCWLSEAMASNPRENYVEFEFSALPETPYLCWVLAGGCCQETFRVRYQATGLTERNRENRNRRESAEPGADMAPELRHRIPYLKRTHADHGGPKEPKRWEWMTVRLPEYEAAGPKKIRLYTGEKGFGVAAVVISSLRDRPPKKEELAALREKLRRKSDPAAEGLLGWWRLDELKGSVVGDASGSGLEGAFEGAPGWDEGRLGGAVRFAGGECVKVDHDGSLNAYPVSLSAWIRTTRAGGGILNKYVSGSKNGYQIYLYDGELRAWYFKDDANYVWDEGEGINGGKVNDGKWHHVAFVVDEAGGRVYVDGVLKKERAWKGTPGATTTTESLRLGLYPGTKSGGSHFTGVIDDARLYGRALTADEVARLAEGDPAEARSAAEAAAADAAEGWEKLFDGETVECLSPSCHEAWRVEDGAIVGVEGADNAAQSIRSFTDGAVRIRFEIGAATHFRFSVRQGPEGAANAALESRDLASLGKGIHELVVVCRGDEVDASVNGKPIGVTGNKSARNGRIQFNVRGSGLRVIGLDYRP